MSLVIKIANMIIAALIISACGGGGGSAPVPPPVIPPVTGYQQPEPSICDFSLINNSGLLCAIRPSRLDALSRDVFSNQSNADFLLGFGYHAVAFPATGTDIKGIYIHLTGSYGRPFNQNNDNFPSAVFLSEALNAGLITIQIAYNNRYAISLDECAGEPERFNVDNCAGDVRLEKITGDDVSTVTDTPLEDSIEYRLLKLIEYFDSLNIWLPVSVINNGLINWQNVRVGGHSQGAGHALYLGKYFASGDVCMLAGGYDVPDAIPAFPAENIADWFLDDSVTLDISKIRALVSVDDSSYDAFIRGYTVLGLQKDLHYVEFSGAPYSNMDGNTISGHSAALNDPRYASLRFDACFADK